MSVRRIGRGTSISGARVSVGGSVASLDSGSVTGSIGTVTAANLSTSTNNVDAEAGVAIIGTTTAPSGTGGYPVNIRWNASTSLGSVLSVGDMIEVKLLHKVHQATTYTDRVVSALSIDGVSQAINWGTPAAYGYNSNGYEPRWDVFTSGGGRGTPTWVLYRFLLVKLDASTITNLTHWELFGPWASSSPSDARDKATVQELT